MEEKVKKINLIYLLGYILIPALVCAICFLLCGAFFSHGGTGAVLLTLVPAILAIAWWSVGGVIIFKQSTKQLERAFNAAGYRRNQTFYGRGKTVILDTDQGILGLVFFWNPFQHYIVPASRIEEAWVDDGKGGAGFLEGSSRTSFLFAIDGQEVRVDTFISNQRFRMDDNRILTGISKADMMVKHIEAAKAKSTGKSIKSTSSKETKENDSSKNSTKAKSEKK